MVVINILLGILALSFFIALFFYLPMLTLGAIGYYICYLIRKIFSNV